VGMTVTSVPRGAVGTEVGAIVTGMSVEAAEPTVVLVAPAVEVTDPDPPHPAAAAASRRTAHAAAEAILTIRTPSPAGLLA
jgi:hypothetical protein